jgi:hypothetical protein
VFVVGVANADAIEVVEEIIGSLRVGGDGRSDCAAEQCPYR